MIAAVQTTKAFDLVLVAHVLVAIAALVVILVLRSSAVAVWKGGVLSPTAQQTFSGGLELAGRVVHVVPLTGLLLLALSRGAYGFTTGFVVVGLTGWVLAAAALEGVAFPAQRTIAASLAAGTDARPDARRLARATELAALALVATAVVMVIGPAA